jgi:cytochrome c2
MKLIAILTTMFLVMIAATDNQSAQAPAAATTKQQTKQTNVSDGEKLFDIHCQRCHKPPEDLSPREAKIVLRHMRVRANLSEADEQAILKYISPR